MTSEQQAGVDAALHECKARFANENPRSAAVYAAACEVMPGGNTRSNLYYAPFPLCFDGGEGATLRDADGHRYVDFLGEYTAGVFGHSDSSILRAIREVSSQGLNLGGHNRWEQPFARALVSRFPGLRKVRFGNSGTEANLMAIGAARAFTGREKVIVFDGGYHGGALTFTTASHPLNVPYPYLVARYNDAESVRLLIEDNPGTIAALIVEPMLSSGGCIPGTDAFLLELRRLTEAAGIVLIFDEVVTSRLAPAGVHGALGIQPDLLTLGKYIGGGLGCGAFGGRADIMDLFDAGRPGAVTHAGTFNNNTLTMGVGEVAVTRVFPPEAAVALSARGEILRDRLNASVRRRDLPMQFTGRGSSMNLHFRKGEIARPDAETRGHAAEKALYFFHLLSKGIYLAPRGMLNVSLAHSDADLDAVVEATESFVERYGRLLDTSSTSAVMA